MRRLSVLLSVAAVILLGSFAVARTGLTAAQDDTIAAERHVLTGSWRLTVTEDQAPPFLAFGTFGADGTVVVSPPPVVPPSPHGPDAVIHTSAGHGAWEGTAPDTAILTFLLLATDAEGTPFATRTVRASVMLGADGQTFSGDFVATIADPAGNPIATESGDIQATRIVAEAPGTPLAGTPIA